MVASRSGWQGGDVFDTILGLPVHALVVHAVVVVVPVACAGTVAIAVVPRWRERYGGLVLLAATAGLVLVPVATRSGNELRDRLDVGGVVARQVKEHADLGNRAIWAVLVFWLLTAALVLMSRRADRSSRAVTVVAVLAVLGAVVAGGVVARVGHLGSTAVWACTIGSDACK